MAETWPSVTHSVVSTACAAATAAPDASASRRKPVPSRIESALRAGCARRREAPGRNEDGCGNITGAKSLRAASPLGTPTYRVGSDREYHMMVLDDPDDSQGSVTEHELRARRRSMRRARPGSGRLARG